MNAQALSKLYGYNHYALKANLEGMTHEESLRCPEPAGNCANWVLGHVLANRSVVLGLLDEPPILPDAEAAPYVRGSKPMRAGAGAIRLERLLADLDRSQERIAAGLARATTEAFDATSGQNNTVGGSLAFLQFHEAYHAGQLGLRRLCGREGAIQ